MRVWVEFRIGPALHAGENFHFMAGQSQGTNAPTFRVVKIVPVVGVDLHCMQVKIFTSRRASELSPCYQPPRRNKEANIDYSHTRSRRAPTFRWGWIWDDTSGDLTNRRRGSWWETFHIGLDNVKRNTVDRRMA